MPSGRRMSSEWTTTSPSQVSSGPGGCFVEVSTASKRSSVSAGDVPRSTAMSLSCSLARLKPDASSLGKNAGPAIFAVAVMCARTSRTVHLLHSEGVAHCSSDRPRTSSARDLRSAWMTGQISMVPPGLAVDRQATTRLAVGALFALAGHLTALNVTMLIERGEFLAALLALLREAAAGQGRLVFLGGEAGVGKTTLTAALAG